MKYFFRSKRITLKNKSILKKICKIMNVEPSIFYERKFVGDKAEKPINLTKIV